MRHRYTELLRISALLAIVIFFHVSSFAKYSGGSGTIDDPYQIGAAADLVALSQNTSDWSGMFFELSADIDMAGQTLTPIGSVDNAFSGNFDGKKHSISNLTITPVLVDSLARKGTGLFGAFNGNLTKLGLINVNIDVSQYQNSSRVGGLVGELVSGKVSECYSEGGTINVGGGGWTGGIVGALFMGGSKTVENCYSTTTVMAGWGQGGIVGSNRGPHKIDKVAFYGTMTKGPAITTVQTGTPGQKEGIPPTNAVYKIAGELSDDHASGINADSLLLQASYPGFDFESVWEIDESAGYAIFNDTIIVQELEFFEKIRVQRVESDTSIIWKNFGPGMAGYNEEFWCHPTDTNVMFMGPDMHVSYGSWDDGLSWHTLKDYDGDGMDLERINDMQFSLLNPDYGLAIERRGKIFETQDRGRSWKLIYNIPHAADSPWYNAHSKMAIHPTNDSICYIGAGGFWDVKGTWRSEAKPQGTHRPIYAYGYILKTTDRGQSWTKVATSIDDKLDVGRIMINPNQPDSMVIATAQGMFLSSDAGETWNPGSTGLPNNLPKDLAAYYNPDTKEYILYTVEQSVYTESGNTIVTEGGVFKSTDGGVSWSNITGNLGLDFTVITEYGFRDRYALTVAYWLGKNKSEIAAKDYPNQTLPVFRRLVVNPLNKDELYLVPNQRHDKSFGPGDIWKTEDGGLNWKIVARHGTYWHAAKNRSYWENKGMVTTPNVEFAHLQEALDEQLETSSANRNLAINANGHVFIGINQQTHRSRDGGTSWQQVDDYETSPGSNAWVGRGGSDLPGRFMLHKTGIPDRRLFCSGEHGLWQTANLGTYPDKDAVAVRQIEGQVYDLNGMHSAHSISTVAVHPHDPNTIFILAWRQSHRGWLRKTTDGGKTWNNVVQLFDADNGSWEAVASQYSLLIDPVNPDNMYFTAILKPISCGTNSGPGVDLTMGEYGVHRSGDGGQTWQVINNGFPANASVNRIIMDPDDPNILFAALNQWSNNDPYGLYKSTNKGDSWTKMTFPSVIRSVNNIFIDEKTKNMYMCTGARAGNIDAGGLYRSKDGGVNWELIFEAPYVWHAETSPVNSDMILVNVARQAGDAGLAFKNPGLYLSKDDGDTWTKINRGIGQPDKMVDIELDPYNENILWVAGWGSGWFKAMLPTDYVEARCNDAEVDENELLTLYGIGSLGTQLEYEWIAPEGIELSSENQYKTTFTAPEVYGDSTLIFQLQVSNAKDQDTTEVKVKVIDKTISSLAKVNKAQLQLYPNPVNKSLTVMGLEKLVGYSIINIQGKVIQSGISKSNVVDVANLNTGIYLLKVTDGTNNHLLKFLKM